jgi:hypothetical protein
MSNDFENDMGEVFQNFRLESEKKDLIFDHILNKVDQAQLKTAHKRKRLFLLFLCIGICATSITILSLTQLWQPNQLTHTGKVPEIHKLNNTYVNPNNLNSNQLRVSRLTNQMQDQQPVKTSGSNTHYTHRKNNTLLSHHYLKDIITDKRISKNKMNLGNTVNTKKQKEKIHSKNLYTTNQSTHLNNQNKFSITQSEQISQTDHTSQTMQTDNETVNTEWVAQEIQREQNNQVELAEILPVIIPTPYQPGSQSVNTTDIWVEQEPSMYPNVLQVSSANRNRFSIGVRCMPMVSFNHYGFQDTSAILPFSTLAGNSLLLSQRIKDDVPSFSYNVGVFATYQPISYLRLELGVNYCSYSTPFSFRDTSTSSSWPFLNENEVYDYDYELKHGQFTTTANYIGVPITVVGILPVGRVELGLRVSATPSFITMADTYTYDYNYTYLRHSEYSAADTIFNRINFNLSGGIHIAYTWKDVLRFSLTPEISYNITSLYQNHYAISQNTWGIGGNLGIEYLFTRRKKK